MDKNLDKLKKLLVVMDEDALTKTEFVNAFADVVKVIKKVEAKHETTVKKLGETLDALRNKIQEENTNSVNTFKGFADKELNKILSEANKKSNEIDNKLSAVRNGIDGRDGRDGADGKDGVSANSEQILKELINRLEELLEERDKDIEERISAIRRTARIGGGTPHNLTQVHDMTSQTDGATKEFTIPVARHFIMLFCPDFPIIYRPNTDYTVAGRTLTLTSEVDAPQSGQTLLLLYVK